MNKSEEENRELERFLESEKQYLPDLRKIDLDKNWERFQSRSSRYHPAGHKPDSFDGGGFRILWIAASVALLITLAFTINRVLNRVSMQVTHVASTQHQTEIHLEDGSRIWLKRGSTISYPRKFKKSLREASLTGEAYFEIERDNRAPFQVSVGEQIVKVLGTSFSVSEEENRIRVHVLSGLVSFYNRGDEKNAVYIHKEEEYIFHLRDQTFRIQQNPSSNFLYWKTGRLEYSRASLDTVFLDMERIFEVEFVIRDEDLLQKRLTTTFEKLELEEILKEMSILHDFHYRVDKDNDIVWIGI